MWMAKKIMNSCGNSWGQFKKQLESVLTFKHFVGMLELTTLFLGGAADKRYSLTKKDEIAVVVSMIYSLLPIFAMVVGEGGGFLFLFPVFLYWGYRFIQGDISFIGKKRWSVTVSAKSAVKFSMRLS